MTIVRVGATKKYSDGWDAAFGGKKKSGAAKPKKTAAKKATKTSAKKKPARQKK